jgi:hypothetical protein
MCTSILQSLELVSMTEEDDSRLAPVAAQLRHDGDSATFAMNDVSDDGSNAMRKIELAVIAAMGVVFLLGGPVAVAQNDARSGGSAYSGSAPQTSPNSGGPIEAPIGHRQPRVGDVPQGGNIAKPDAEDAALDRKIKSICRGC